MDNYFVPFKDNFKNHFINVLDIDSGVEFVADDIFSLVGCANVIKFYDFNLPDNFYKMRTVLMNGLLCDVETLKWLGLQQIFAKVDYQNQKEFTRWTRKHLLPVLSLEKLNDFNVETLNGINTLPLFSNNDNKFIESLASFYKSNLNFLDGEISSLFGFNHNTLSFNYHSTYLKLLKKEVDIPGHHKLRTSDLKARLLRQSYLEPALKILAVSNVGYFTLYNAFVCNQNNLLLAQQLDIAVLSELKNLLTPCLILQIIEGGFFLQSLLGCTLENSIEASIFLQIKDNYICRLNQILENIKV